LTLHNIILIQERHIVNKYLTENVDKKYRLF